MSQYLIPNGPMPTTAAFAKVDTGTAVKTMLQVKLGAAVTQWAKIIEWGISFDGFAAALPIQVELLHTSTVKATVTEHVATGIHNLDPGGIAVTDDNPFAFGATGDETGYTATVEGAIATVGMYDLQLLPPTAPYVKQFPLGREPGLHPNDFLRIRVTAGTAVNAYCYVVIEI